MPYESLSEVWKQQADRRQAEVNAAKAREQLPHAERDLLSQIQSRESTTRYRDAQTRRSNATLPFDVAIKKANAKMKAQELVELMRNPELRMAHEAAMKRMELNKAQAFNEMFAENPDRYKAILATEVEAKKWQGREDTLRAQKEQKFQYFTDILTAYDAGGSDAANRKAAQIAEQWQSDFGTPFPYQTINEETIGQINKVRQGLVDSIAHIRDIQHSQANATDSSTGMERMIAEKTALEEKRETEGLTQTEEFKLNNLTYAVEGKRFTRVTDPEGNVNIVDSGGRVTEVTTGDGEPLKDIDKIKEDRRKASAIAENQKKLTDTLFDVAGDDIDYVKDTRGVDLSSGRESVDDVRLTYMFARTLPGINKDVSRGDIEDIASTPGLLPEKIVAGLRAFIQGRNIPPDVREAMIQRIKIDRSLRANFARKTISDLKQQAKATNTPDWTPPGMPKGSELNPIRLEKEMSDEEIMNAVQPGEWFLDTDNVLKQRPEK